MAPLIPGFIREGRAFHSYMELSPKRDLDPQAQKKGLISQDVLCPAASSLNREISFKKRLGQLSDQQSDHYTLPFNVMGPHALHI